MSAAKIITNNSPLCAQLIPLELAADVALTDCKHKNHPTCRQKKSDDITGSDSSFIIVPTLSFGQVQTSIRGLRKYEIFMVVGNELHAVTWQRNNPSQTQTTLQWWAPGRVWPLHAVVKLHSIKSELSQTGAGDCWVQSWESPDTARFSNINCSTSLAAINSMLLQSCQSMYCMYLNSDKATRGKCSADH